MTDLTALIDRLERAKKGSRKLSDEMLEALEEFYGPLTCRDRGGLGRPDPTRSMDDARGLVPKGRAIAILIYENGKASVAIGEPPQFGEEEYATQALALCIALCRALMNAAALGGEGD